MKGDNVCQCNSDQRLPYSAEVIFSMPREDLRRSLPHSRSESDSALQSIPVPKPGAAAARGSACCSHWRAEFPLSMQSLAELGLDSGRRTRCRSEGSLYLEPINALACFHDGNTKREVAQIVWSFPQKEPL